MNSASERAARCHWGLYAILDRAISGLSHVDAATQLIKGGAKVLQLRDKKAPFEELMEIGAELRKLTRDANVTLIVNDNPYLAREIDADGVHIGQNDFPPDIVREVVGPNRLVGLSTHSKQQILAATTFAVDYIGIGPIYLTSTKASTNVPVSTSLIRWASHNVALPIVAIGGITAETIPDVVAAGAHNVAMIGGLLSAEDIAKKTSELRQLVQEYKAE
jgi:thiamine-phosphate pyrophosphorylase